VFIIVLLHIAERDYFTDITDIRIDILFCHFESLAGIGLSFFKKGNEATITASSPIAVIIEV
jgi:hypothetical protein